MEYIPYILYFFQLDRLRVFVGASPSNDGSLRPVAFSKLNEIRFYPLGNYPEFMWGWVGIRGSDECVSSMVWILCIRSLSRRL